MSRALALVLLVAACGGEPSRPPATPESAAQDPTCADVEAFGTAFMQEMIEEAAQDPDHGGAEGYVPDAPAVFGRGLVELCAEQRWSVAYIRCTIAPRGDDEGMSSCDERLGEAERDANMRALMRLFDEVHPPDGVPLSDGPTTIAECDALLAALEAESAKCPQALSPEMVADYRDAKISYVQYEFSDRSDVRDGCVEEHAAFASGAAGMRCP